MTAHAKFLPELISENLGAEKDGQSITSSWEPARELIEGVRVREVRNVVRADGGVLCEVFRRDWMLDDGAVDQVFQSLLDPGTISAWHAHRVTTDRLFVSSGVFQIVLYDARQNSRTPGRINEFRFGTIRPALVIIPPGVFHGVRNISRMPAILLNLVDKAYQYEDPDHWRLPLDTDKIPYRFQP